MNRAKLEDLKDIIERYGEDPQAGRIARAIVEARVRNVSDDQVTAEFTLRAKTGAQTAVEVTV